MRPDSHNVSSYDSADEAEEDSVNASLSNALFDLTEHAALMVTANREMLERFIHDRKTARDQGMLALWGSAVSASVVRSAVGVAIEESAVTAAAEAAVAGVAAFTVATGVAGAIGTVYCVAKVVKKVKAMKKTKSKIEYHEKSKSPSNNTRMRIQTD